MINEFRKFILRGNVLDLAVGVMIGAAFSKIVSSLVNDVIMPIISVFTSGISLVDLRVIISPAVMNGDIIVKSETAFRYGSFIQSIIDFLIIAICIFLIVKAANTIKDRMDKIIPKKGKKEEETAPVLTKDQQLLVEIRDLLNQNNK